MKTPILLVYTWKMVIWRAYKQTGKQVFILVDEYDSPMLDSMEDKQLQKEQ